MAKRSKIIIQGKIFIVAKYKEVSEQNIQLELDEENVTSNKKCIKKFNKYKKKK